jgi:hypothetical protein
MPAGFDIPSIPDDYETLSNDMKAHVTWEHKMAGLLKAYTIVVAKHPFRECLARTPNRNTLIFAAKVAGSVAIYARSAPV